MKPAKAAPSSAVVVGGGIIGLAAAFRLRRLGIDTLLVDAEGAAPPASWGNAGHIAVEQVEPLASRAIIAGIPGRLFIRGGPVGLPLSDIGAWLPFACRLARASAPHRFQAGKAALSGLMAHALPAWRRLAADAHAGQQLVEDGHFVLWETDSAARRGRARWMRADIGTARVRDLTRAEATAIGALLARAPAGGLHFGGTARVRDPSDLLARLAAAFVDAGGLRRAARVRRIVCVRGRAQPELDGGARLDADLVVVAAGVGSARLLRPLGCRVPIVAERGYHIQAQAQGWPDMPPVVFEERSMIVSRFRSGLRAAGCVEFAHERSPPDARKWRRLHAHAAELRLPFDAPPREWMGARPTLPDYLPAIGRSPCVGNLAYAFGHQHLGLTLAAVTAELVAALASGEAPGIDLAPFALERF